MSRNRVCVALAALALFAVTSAGAATFTYTAPSGNFSTAANWDLGSVPGSSDDVVIPGGCTVTVSTVVFEVGSLALGNSDGSGTAATLTFACGSSAACTVGGDVHVYKGGKINHTAPGSSATSDSTSLHKVYLEVGGDMTIDSGASINVVGLGFVSKKGPGWAGKSAATCASHAGEGMLNNESPTRKFYGSFRMPFMYGSGGGQYSGGGAVRLTVAGTLTVNGGIYAYGRDGTSYGEGSGGSIWLTAGKLVGAGSISARGGDSTSSSYPKHGGGGGRIAIYQTVADDTSLYTGSLVTAVSATQAGAGTIYIENAGDGEGLGTLIIDGGNYESSGRTVFNASTPGFDTPIGAIVVKNKGRVLVGSGVTVKATRGIVAKGNAFLSEATGGGVQLCPAAGQTAVLSGTIGVSSFECSAPGATLSVSNGTALTVNEGGAFTLAGAPSNLLNILSATEGAAYSFKLQSDVVQSVSDVAVENCNASGNTITGTGSTDLGGNNNWSFLSAVADGELITWTGAEDTAFVNVSNWSPARSPWVNDVILIPSGLSNYPVITTSFIANSITNELGATITLDGANLTVTNNLVSSGTIVFRGDETLYFAGDGSQTAALGGNTYSHIVVDKPEGSVTFAESFTAGIFECHATNSLSLLFAPSSTYTFTKRFYIDGYVAGSPASHLLTLASTTPSSAWRLSLPAIYKVRGVRVSDCDATVGRMIKAGLFATDLGNNLNWDFTGSAIVEWIGVSGAAFLDAENWEPAIVPGLASRAVIAPDAGTYSLTLPASTNWCVGSLVLGGGGGTVTLAARSPVVVSEAVQVRDRGTLALDYFAEPNVVTGGVLVCSGGAITHSGPATAESYKINLSVLGDLTIDEGGSISVKGKGYSLAYGPGSVNNGANGGTHGGRGFRNTKRCYGSILEPYRWGSGARVSAGGGAVKLDVAGALTVNGSINAESGDSSEYGLGAGGSICIKAQTLLGAGLISAGSGKTGSSAAGAGGRIAIYLGTADRSTFGGTVTVTRNVVHSAGGTIYRQFGDQEQYGGTIYFNSVTTSDLTEDWVIDFPMADDAAVTGTGIKNAYEKARLYLDTNVRLNMSGDASTGVASNGYVRVKDIMFSTSDSKYMPRAYMNGRTIKVLDRTHRNGQGWISTYNTHVPAANRMGGAIVWPTSLQITVR